MALPDLTVTILCRPGVTRLRPCLASLAAAAAMFRTDITLLVSGLNMSAGRQAAAAIRKARRALAGQGTLSRIYVLDDPDPATALNHALTTLCRPARLAVFLDGSSRIALDSLSGMAALLSSHPETMAATGIPAGNSAAATDTVNSGGRLHPALFAFRPACLDRWAASGLWLPKGLCDPHWLLARLVCHDLDPTRHRWNPHRILGAAEAVFTEPPGFHWPHPFRAAETVRVQMERAALLSLLARRGADFPASADALLADWLAWGGTISVRRGERPFLRGALRRIASVQPVESIRSSPVLAPSSA